MKEKLEEKGHKFKSRTDTEVIARLIEGLYDGERASGEVAKMAGVA